MLDEKLNGIELLIIAYNIRSDTQMIQTYNNSGMITSKPKYKNPHYLVFLEGHIENYDTLEDKPLSSRQILVDSKDVEDYTKFLSWCKEKHPEIVIKYEMTKDAKQS
jgi:hypothetical protein